VMRNYVDQESAQTKGANRTTLLSGEPSFRKPAPTSEKEKKLKLQPAKRVKRTQRCHAAA